MPAAEPIPATPNGAKSFNWFASYAVNEMTTNMASTPSLISTMIALTFADSLAPRISSSAHNQIRKTAGKFTMPGSASQGAAVKACSTRNPNKLVSSLLTYPLQPTETAAVANPYSSSTQAATATATASPSVVYAYE